MTALRKRVPLRLDCPRIDDSDSFCLTQGIPFAEGELRHGAAVRVVDASGNAYATQAQTLATWRPDRRDVKWLLVDAQLPGELSGAPEELYVEHGEGVTELLPDDPVQVGLVDERSPAPDVIGNSCLCVRFRRMSPDPGPQFLASLQIRNGDSRHDMIRGEPGPSLYMVDSRGRRYDSLTAASPPLIRVEERGPVRSSVCVRGMHADRQGRPFCPYFLRIHFFAGSARMRVFHTFVFDQDPDEVKLAGIGMRFPWDLGEEPRVAFGGEISPHRAAGWRNAAWLQADDRNYRVQLNGQPFDKGRTTRGWASLSGSRASVAVVLRDAWRECPKGIKVDRNGEMDVQFWPQDTGRLLDLEVPWKEDFINCSGEGIRTERELLKAMAERPTAGVNFKGFYGTADMPEGSAEGDMQSVKEARAFAKKHLRDRRFVLGDVSPHGRATGLAKTHEFWLDLRAEATMDAAVEKWAALVQTPPLAPPAPEHVCDTGVLGIMHPRDRENFGEVETGLEAMFDNLLDGPVSANRLYGMIDYGDLLNCHGRCHGYTYRVFGDDPELRITDLIGWYNNECFDNNFTQWINFLRTGERKYWRLAEAYSEHLEDVDTIHADPRHPEWIGLTHYHNILHWSAGASGSHTQVHGWLLHYFLTGNRRALEVSRAAAENFLRSREPAGMVSNRHGVLRREFTGPMGTLWLLYRATWEEEFRDCALRSLDIFLAAQLESGHFPRDIFTGGERGDEFTVTADIIEPRGWLQEAFLLRDIYRLTGDERIEKAVIRAGDALVGLYRDFLPGERAELLGDTYMIQAKPPVTWLAFAYELTSDDKYLAPLREFLSELPAMARAWAAFDKWTPIQIAGYISRYAAVAMAPLTGDEHQP